MDRDRFKRRYNMIYAKLSGIFSVLSLLKNKLYCNTEEIVYIKDDENTLHISPTIQTSIKQISNSIELKKYASNEERIAKNVIKFKYFLNQGCRMYVTSHKNNITGYYFVCKILDFKPYPYNKLPLFQGDKSHYIFFCHTFSEYRGNNIYPYVLTQIYEDVRKNSGLAFISTGVNNISSQRGIEKAGFRRLCTLKYISIANMSRYKVDAF